jgi:opacity protein-like surface antigen
MEYTMMHSGRVRQRFFLSLILLTALSLIAIPAQAEWYVAGQAGYSFADALRNVKGTGALSGLEAPDFDLKNSLAYGGKVGVYPFHGSLGFELDVFHSTPHVKNLDDIPGIHLAVTNVGANILLRYPGVTFQPYLGAGPGILIARLSRSATTEQDTQVSIGLNFLTGIRAFVTPKVALFTEYKYTDAKFGFNGAFGSLGGFDSTYSAHQLFVGVSYHF